MCTPAQEGCNRRPLGEKALMAEDQNSPGRVMVALQQAIDDWACRGNEQPLTRWLSRELDSEGAPIRLQISDWPICLKRLLELKPHHGVWPQTWDEPIIGLLRMTFWFTRGDGAPVTHFEPSTPNNTIVRLDLNDTPASIGPRIEQIIERWMKKELICNPTHERPAWRGPKCVLAVVRPGWRLGDDFLAIDHRELAPSCRFELFGGGRSWLGPAWMMDGELAVTAPARPQFWICGPSAGLAEWSYRAGEARISHSALVLRGRSLALLSVLVEQRSLLPLGVRLRLSLPPRIVASPVTESRAVLLTTPNKPGAAQVAPIGLPALPYPTDRGMFRVEDHALVLSNAPRGRRAWLPLLVSWDSLRRRRELHWRTLTVSEKSRKVDPDRAFAVRVSWGREETYIIYRSLGPPAPRAFIGHETTARFLVGLFKPDGTLEPILKVH
jgi:hypothetical protein